MGLSSLFFEGARQDQGAGRGVHVERASWFHPDLPDQPGYGGPLQRTRQDSQPRQGRAMQVHHAGTPTPDAWHK